MRVQDPKIGVGQFATQEQLVHDDRDARQVHRHPEVRAAAAADVRLLRVLEHRRQGHARRARRQDQGGRHRPVHVRRVGPGRPRDVRPRTRTTGRRGKPYLDGDPACSILRDAAGHDGRSSRRARSTSCATRRARTSRASRRPEVPGASRIRLTAARYAVGVNTTIAAARQQAGAPGAQLRHRPQALRRHRAAGRRASRESLPWSERRRPTRRPRADTYTFDLDKARALLAQAGVVGPELDIMPNPANRRGAVTSPRCTRPTWPRSASS